MDGIGITHNDYLVHQCNVSPPAAAPPPPSPLPVPSATVPVPAMVHNGAIIWQIFLSALRRK